jgi:4-hydroxybenzoate polyprenyltransferase
MTFFKLIRYKNLIMVLLTMVLVKYCLTESIFPRPYLSDVEFVIYALSVLFITAGGYIINDIYDVKIDRINKPKKVFVGNSISIKNAWILYTSLSIVGLGLAVFISIQKQLSFHIFYYLFGFACLFFYSKYFQRKPLIGNIIIAFICGALIYLTKAFDLVRAVDIETFIQSLPSDYHIHDISFGFMTINFYILFSFTGTLIREIVKDIEDVDGDYNAGYQTLPILFGKRRTRNFVIVLSILFSMVLITYLLVFYAIGYLALFYGLTLVLIISLYFIYRLWSAKTKRHFHLLSNLMKIILFLGILSMILFTFNP